MRLLVWVVYLCLDVCCPLSLSLYLSALSKLYTWLKTRHMSSAKILANVQKGGCKHSLHSDPLKSFYPSTSFSTHHYSYVWYSRPTPIHALGLEYPLGAHLHPRIATPWVLMCLSRQICETRRGIKGMEGQGREGCV